jgi:dolichol-phosphate mannosyltransferase
MSGVPLSVVMPVYNEVANLAHVLRDLQQSIMSVVDGSELVIVDDHSTDGSSEILARLAADDARVRVLRNARNAGHGPSVRRGMEESRGDWILHIDSDGQLDLSEFTRLWSATGGHDLVLGIRTHRHDPPHRRVVTAGTAALGSLAARRRLQDANTPFKLIRRPLFEHVAPSIPATAFAPTVLLIVAAARAGARLAEIPITHLERPHGRSTLRVGKLATAVASCTSDTIRVGTRRIAPFGR